MSVGLLKDLEVYGRQKSLFLSVCLSPAAFVLGFQDE